MVAAATSLLRPLGEHQVGPEGHRRLEIGFRLVQVMEFWPRLAGIEVQELVLSACVPVLLLASPGSDVVKPVGSGRALESLGQPAVAGAEIAAAAGS